MHNLNTQKIFRISALALALSVCTTSAMARPPQAPIDVAELEAHAAEAFAGADTDSDGLVTPEEFAAMERPKRRQGGHHARRNTDEQTSEQRSARRQAHSDQLFDQLDSDGDDFLSRDEYSAENQRAARKSLGSQRMFERLDADDDGVLTLDEFPPSRMARLDIDGDGTITTEELRQGRASHRNQDS